MPLVSDADEQNACLSGLPTFPMQETLLLSVQALGLELFQISHHMLYQTALLPVSTGLHVLHTGTSRVHPYCF